MLQPMGSWRVRHNLATEQQQEVTGRSLEKASLVYGPEGVMACGSYYLHRPVCNIIIRNELLEVGPTFAWFRAP